MAVQAQYPSNVLLLNRKEQETKEFPQSPNDFVLPSMDLLDYKGDKHPRNRAREAGGGASMAATQVEQQPINWAPPPPLPSSPMTMVSLARLQNNPPPPLVSTGLQLSFENNQHQNQMIHTDSSSSQSRIPQEVVALINQEREGFQQFLIAQEERFCRELAEKRLRHYRALLSAVQESALRRLRQKEAELELVTRRGYELQEHLGRLQVELRAWQATAMTSQTTAAALQTQLEQAMNKTAEGTQWNENHEYAESPAAEDAQSAFIDPERVEPGGPGRACRACGTLPATVVLLPCRHLCLCEACDALFTRNAGGDLAPSCPVCQCARTGRLQVFLVVDATDRLARDLLARESSSDTFGSTVSN